MAIRRFNPAQLMAPHALWPQVRVGAPIDIEIGCGPGWHPIQYAKENPEREIIAIEHTRSRFASFEQRHRHHPELVNLHAVHANAIEYIAHRVPDHSISRYFLLYPNPEPKNRARRWHAMPFMGTLLDKLVDGGTLEIATNVLDYAQEARRYFESEWKLCLASERVLDSTELARARTHFELKYLKRGDSCFNQVWQKSVGSSDLVMPAVNHQ